MAGDQQRAARLDTIFESYVAAMDQVRGSPTSEGQLKTRLLALEAFVQTALLVLARDAGDVDAFLEEMGNRVASVRDTFDAGGH